MLEKKETIPKGGNNLGVLVANSLFNQQPKIKKECSGCGDKFFCLTSQNYDYCLACAINGNRYAQNKCAECGDGSGIIKFANQTVRRCKICSLTSLIQSKDWSPWISEV